MKRKDNVHNFETDTCNFIDLTNENLTFVKKHFDLKKLFESDSVFF